MILFQLFGGKVRRFSDLARAIPTVSQKMLIQQLRQLERDGVVWRLVHHQVPPKVEYSLTDWSQALCPALDALLKWAARRDMYPPHSIAPLLFATETPRDTVVHDALRFCDWRSKVSRAARIVDQFI